jgi:hypothetical protein
MRSSLFFVVVDVAAGWYKGIDAYHKLKELKALNKSVG